MAHLRNPRSPFRASDSATSIPELRVQEAVEEDAPAINDLFRAAYGDDYLYPEFYEEKTVKRMIFDDRSLMLVAREASRDRVIGTAGVLFEMGAYSDLVGEFGRLVVHPEVRRRGIGHRLMEERLARVGDRLHVAFTEVRMCTSASPRISQKHGFAPVGFLPMKLVFGGEREHAGLMVKHFGDALSLRRNHPRIIPEAHALAEMAMDRVGLDSHIILDEESAAYGAGGEYDLDELTSRGYAALLRIQRGRVRHREVFGPQRLHYGLFKLAASHSHYLLARDGERIVGALGFMRDERECNLRVFELIYTQPDVVRVLFRSLVEHAVAEGMVSIEVDVSAHAPRLQRTLLEMDYLPAAYVPALAFDEVERVDILKMYRLLVELEELPLKAPEPTLSVCRTVLRGFRRRAVLPRIARAMDRLSLCADLTEEQSTRLLGAFERKTFDDGRCVFGQGEPPDEMYLVLSGSARILVDDRNVGTVGSGECLGEVALLTGTPHSATAVVEGSLETAVLTGGALRRLVRRRPDIGTVVYRNMARGLGEKLRRADRTESAG